MFDFEKLKVYQCSKELNIELLKYLNSHKDLDKYLLDQIKPSSLSMTFNLAEGVGRATKKDKRHFYIMARASCYESVAVLQIIKALSQVDEVKYNGLYSKYTEISKMLYGLIISIRDSNFN